MLMFSLGQISIRFVPCILKFSNGKTNKSLLLTKKKECLHYFILCLLFYFYLGLGSVADYLETGEFTYMQTNLLPNKDFLLMLNFESILIISISICLLKYKYFKHHIISLVVFVSFGCSCYIFHLFEINKNISKHNFLFILFIIMRLFQAAVEAIYFCYKKYMMEKLYYPYWNIAFVPGIILLIFSLGGIILGFIEGINFEFFSVNSYFKDGNDIAKPVLKLITILIFHIIMSPLTILIIFYFSPNFILIVYQCTCIVNDIITYSKNLFFLFSIPLYIIQIFALLIYLEVLELNFCGLNKNTKRNIYLREKEDLLNENRSSSVDINGIDVETDYTIKISENSENDIEPEENLK